MSISFPLKLPKTALYAAWLCGSLNITYVAQSAADGTFRHGMVEDSRLGPGPLVGCGAKDPDCSFTLLRLASGINFGHPSVTGGVLSTAGDEPLQLRGTGALRLEAVNADLPIGDLHVGRVEAVVLPDSAGVRLRLTLAQSEAFFICTDENGHLHLPFVGRTQVKCRPDAHPGGGIELGELQWDTATGRFAGRWAQFNGVLNFFGNGNGMDYLRRHLNVILGVSADSVWHGTTPGASPDPTHQLRGVMGLSGLVRSPDAAWEFDADFIFRPSIIGTEGEFSNLAWDARARLVRQFPITHGQQEGTNLLLSAGLEGAASYYQVPADSFGEFASATQPYSLYVGATFGLSFEFAHY